MAVEALVSAEPESPQSVSIAVASAESAQLSRRRIEVGGVLLDQVDLPAAMRRIEAFARSGEPHQVVTVNLDFLNIAERDPMFRATLNCADLAVPDGMPLVWLSRLQGEPLDERVAGVELVTESCRLAADMGARVFLLGAAEGIAEQAARQLEQMFPGLQVVGTYSPPVGELAPEENRKILDLIRLSRPDFLFVALGAPRQDLWISTHQAEMQVPVAMGVGCVFDLLAGSKRRAPTWMRRLGLEWAFRLVQEPQRLWRRYLLNDLPLLFRLAWTADAPKDADAFLVTP